jgi:hypothetical protein
MGLFAKKKDKVKKKDQGAAKGTEQVTLSPAALNFEIPEPIEKPHVDATICHLILRYREQWLKVGIAQSVNHYFDFMSKIEESGKAGDYKNQVLHCQLSWAFLEPFIISLRMEDYVHSHLKEWLEVMDLYTEDRAYYHPQEDFHYVTLCKKYGRFLCGDEIIPEFSVEGRIKSIPAIEKAMNYNAVMGNSGQLKNLEGLINYFPVLVGLYTESIGRARNDFYTAKVIRKYLKEHPGTMQRDLKKELSLPDGRIASNLCYWMYKFGLLKRVKEGKSYLVSLTY